MIPHDRRGIQLTYGLEGSVSFNVESVVDKDVFDGPRFELPRVRSGRTRKQLQVSPTSSYRRAVPAQIEEEKPAGAEAAPVVPGRKKELYKAVPDGICVSTALLKEMNTETQPDRINGYDPTFDDLLRTCQLSTSVFGGLKLVNVVACAAGPKGDLVAFNVLEQVPEGLESMPRAPSLQDTVVFGIGERVKQILIEARKAKSAIAVIRTDSSVHVLSVRLARYNKLDIGRVDRVDGSQLAGEPLADVYLDSTRRQVVGIVDIMGNFALYNLARDSISRNWLSSCRRVPLSIQTFHDPTDLSQFKKIVVNGTGDKMYLMSRQSIHEYNLVTDRMKCRVIGGAWSVMLDLKRLNTTDGTRFLLLTSKELIVVDGTSGFKRLLAWKHYLTDDDFSWHLDLLPREGTGETIVMISSRQLTMTYVIELSQLETPAPKIQGDPYFVVTHPSDPLQSISIWEQEGFYLCYQATKRLEISSCVLTYEEGNEFYRPLNRYNKAAPVTIPDAEERYRAVTNNHPADNGVARLPLPSGRYATDLAGVTNLSDTIEQNQKGMFFSASPSLWFTMMGPKEGEVERCQEQVTRFFSQIDGAQSSQLADSLTASLVTARKVKPNLKTVQRDSAKLLKELPEDLQRMVGTFEDNMDLPGRYDDVVDDDGMTSQYSASDTQLPTVGSSKKRSHRPKRPASATPTGPVVGISQPSPQLSQSSQRILSQKMRFGSSQPMVGSSQGSLRSSQSSSQRPKKKKRKTGFM